MAIKPPDLLEMAQTGFVAQDAEVVSARDRQLRSVLRQTTTGSGNINAPFYLDRKYRLVFVRCHFAGGMGTAPFSLTIDSGVGSAYDTKLFTITQAGRDKDVNLRLTGDDNQDPSPWTFQPDDRVRILWTNPDSGNMTWGLEVGLSLAA